MPRNRWRKKIRENETKKRELPELSHTEIVKSGTKRLASDIKRNRRNERTLSVPPFTTRSESGLNKFLLFFVLTLKQICAFLCINVRTICVENL